MRERDGANYSHTNISNKSGSCAGSVSSSSPALRADRILTDKKKIFRSYSARLKILISHESSRKSFESFHKTFRNHQPEVDLRVLFLTPLKHDFFSVFTIKFSIVQRNSRERFENRWSKSLNKNSSLTVGRPLTSTNSTSADSQVAGMESRWCGNIPASREFHLSKRLRQDIRTAH